MASWVILCEKAHRHLQYGDTLFGQEGRMASTGQNCWEMRCSLVIALGPRSATT